jgi:hypothetical protein
MEPAALREAIILALRKQGYQVESGTIRLPEGASKQDLRGIHELAVRQKLSVAEPGIRRHENSLLNFIANGTEVSPEKVAPA